MCARIVEGTGVVYDVIGSLDLFCIRPLRRHAPVNFSAGNFFGHVKTLRPSLDALLGAAANHNKPIKLSLRSSLENQRSLDDGDGFWIFPSNVIHPLLLRYEYGGMNDMVQFLNARLPVGSTEGGLC